ncbi:MAG: putative chitinase [Sphingomonadales bacterium]|jgi:putative chitinase|nr:putative chitinase [Sphingomonadales bacterium]MEA3047661.1 putative chitinase [Sphingomonadales bacterium]
MTVTITAEGLKKINPNLLDERARLYASVLEAVRPLADLSTGIRVRHFIAQIAQETGGFRALVESTRYTKPDRLDALFKNVQGPEHARRLVAAGPVAIGNTIYANKNGNGGVESGDGFRFRGRGFMMVTGRANYRNVGAMAGLPLEDQPDLLGEPEPAAKAAAMFWKSRAINSAADANDISMVTFLVNGPARLHLAERRAFLATAQTIWN